MKLKNLLPFILISILIFSKKSNAQTEGDSLFSAAQIHTVYMTFSQVNYWDSLTAYYITDQYLKGDIVIDGVSYPNVGIKFKGNSSTPIQALKNRLRWI
jgi:spore coat protein CotH